MSRLILVSNRIALPAADGAPPAGGLAVAVQAALRGRPGVWLGWSGESAARGALRQVVEAQGIDYALQDIAKDDVDAYYNGYCNRALWPLLHYRIDLMRFGEDQLEAYLRVNGQFADSLAALVRPDDLIWVHDYHLIPLAGLLRQRGAANRIGFFLHVPFPPADVLATLPRHAEVLGGLGRYDLVGFQTAPDRDNFVQYAARHMGAQILAPDRIRLAGRTVRAGVFPVGIETAAFAREATASGRSRIVRETRNSLSDRLMVIGVDRLDYSKGIASRIEAFARLLKEQPAWEGRVTYLQIAPRSRTAVPEYLEMDKLISMRMGQLNGRHGTPFWTPARYLNRNFSRRDLAGLYRAARVGLVTPLRDGMNLVAKEYLAAQDAADPGVLILSEFAGAAAELADSALIVNPYDSQGMAQALERALAMPAAERKTRHERAMAVLEANDIDHWANSFVGALVPAEPTASAIVLPVPARAGTPGVDAPAPRQPLGRASSA